MTDRLRHAEAILRDVLNGEPRVLDKIRDYFNLSQFGECESCGKEYRIGGATRLKRHCAQCVKLPMSRRNEMSLARFRAVLNGPK